MYLSKLTLENFRSYLSRSFEFSSQTNLILGPNGSGKTNILEAIYFLASGKSFRSSSFSKAISWSSTYSSIRGQVDYNDHSSSLEVQLINDTSSSRVSRKFIIDSVSKPRKTFLGVFHCVVFQPEDIRLVSGSPSRRREFLDSVFSSIDWRYASALNQFRRALKHRNELLDQIRLHHRSPSELFFWDQSLIKNSQIVHNFRSSFVQHLNHFFSHHSHPEIKSISLNYHPSPLTSEKMTENYPFDLKRGYTRSGCHHDDFSFDDSTFPSVDKNLANWGSRGQQRLAVLALRLGQIDYLESLYHDSPCLLLDDIFSELDTNHRQLVSEICRRYQTIFTSSEENPSSFFSSPQLLHLSLSS